MVVVGVEEEHMVVEEYNQVWVYLLLVAGILKYSPH